MSLVEVPQTRTCPRYLTVNDVIGWIGGDVDSAACAPCLAPGSGSLAEPAGASTTSAALVCDVTTSCRLKHSIAAEIS